MYETLRHKCQMPKWTFLDMSIIVMVDIIISQCSATQWRFPNSWCDLCIRMVRLERRPLGVSDPGRGTGTHRSSGEGNRPRSRRVRQLALEGCRIEAERATLRFAGHSRVYDHADGQGMWSLPYFTVNQILKAPCFVPFGSYTWLQETHKLCVVHAFLRGSVIVQLAKLDIASNQVLHAFSRTSGIDCEARLFCIMVLSRDYIVWCVFPEADLRV